MSMFVLEEKKQKLPKGALVSEVGDGEMMVVSPVDFLGTTVRLNPKKGGLTEASLDKVGAAVQAMMVHRLKKIAEGEKKFGPGTLLVVPMKERGCVVYEVGELVVDHKPRVKIKYRRDLTSDFQPAPKEIGDEAEIEETWAIVVWLSNRAMLDKYDAVDAEMEAAAVKSAYEGRLVIAMDDHLNEKELNKLQKIQDGEAVAQDDDIEVVDYMADPEYDEDEEDEEEEDEDEEEDEEEPE